MPPELLVRWGVVAEYQDHAIQATIDDLRVHLQGAPGVWWNAYAANYGTRIKQFPYPARNGYFVDMETRMTTHRFRSVGIARRDEFFDDPDLLQLVPQVYQPSWFDQVDAERTYAILITEIQESDPLPITAFGLYNSWGRVNSKDVLHRPRLIKPYHS